MSKKTAVKIAILIFIVLIFMIGIQIKEDMDETHPDIVKIKETILPVDHVIENISFYKGNKSYTINKEDIYICTRDENGKMYDMNTLVFVALHEVAHYKCDEIGHTPKFHQIHEELLRKATKLGIYNPSVPMIRNYCGHT